MAEPAWFFSTIAQAVAASIGFVIAFTATVYASRQARFQTRLTGFQQDIGELHSDYGPAIDSFSQFFKSEYEFADRVSIEDVDEWIDESTHSEVAEFWIQLDRVYSQLSSIPSTDDSTELSNRFTELREGVQRVEEMTSNTKIDENPLIQDYSKNHDIEHASRGAFFEFFQFDKKARRSLAELDQRYDVDRLGHWNKMFTDLDRKLDEINNRRGTEWLDRDNQESRDLLRKSLGLFIVGVILPMGYLVDIPPWIIPNVFTGAATYETFILISELIILTVVVVMSVVVIRGLIDLIGA